MNPRPPDPTLRLDFSKKGKAPEGGSRRIPYKSPYDYGMHNVDEVFLFEGSTETVGVCLLLTVDKVKNVLSKPFNKRIDKYC